MKKVTCVSGDKDTGKLIISDTETGKVKEIKAVVFTKEQSNKILEIVDKLY